MMVAANEFAYRVICPDGWSYRVILTQDEKSCVVYLKTHMNLSCRNLIIIASKMTS